MRSVQSLGVWLALVVPSLAIVDRFLPWPALVVYPLAVWLLLGHAHRAVERLSASAATRLAWVTWIAVVLVFAVAHPRIDSQDPGVGSDDDEAHELGVAALLRGESPYAQRTYLDNTLNQLTGSYVLAAPFVLVTGAAAQNLFWLAAFFVAVAKTARDARVALVLAWLVLVASPGVMAHVVTGTGYPANAITVLLGLWWLTRTRHPAMTAAIWGVALTSRANFLLLLPIAIGWLYRRVGAVRAVRAGAMAGLVVVVLVAPFYSHDPDVFTPLAGAERLWRFDAWLPHASTVIVTMMAGLALVSASRPMTLADLFTRCAVVQAVPIVAGVVLSALASDVVWQQYAGYGSFFSWFLLMAHAASEHEDGQGAEENENRGSTRPLTS